MRPVATAWVRTLVAFWRASRTAMSTATMSTATMSTATMSTATMSTATISAVLAAACLSACSTLSEFSTGDDQVYRGQVTGRTEAGCTSEPCSFIRRGFPEDLVVELTFDPSEASSNPGTLRSSEGVCGRFFDNDPLLPITPLAHDDLSLYEFPGARLQNYIFAVNPTAGPLATRDVVAFLALRDNGDVGLRIMAGSGARVCPPSDCEAFARGECDVFGVFTMEKSPR